VGGEGKGELVAIVWLVKFSQIRACVEAGLPDHLDQQKNASQDNYVNRPFSKVITHTWKFDYYSTDHTWGGGSTRFK